MFRRKNPPAPPAPTPAPVDTTQRIECKGQVLNKTPFLNGAYTYFHVAILVQFPDGGKEDVLEHYGSGSDKALALCKPGHAVKVFLCRTQPEYSWIIQKFVIVYDIEREKAALAKLTA